MQSLYGKCFCTVFAVLIMASIASALPSSEASQKAEHHECVRRCPHYGDPVCGNDNQTYDNKCYLECDAIFDPELKMKYHGQCERMTPPEVYRS